MIIFAVTDKSAVFYVVYAYLFKVACHIEDIPENGADVAHLPAIHEVSIFGGGEPSKYTSWASMWSWHEYSVSWKPKSKMDQFKGKYPFIIYKVIIRF